MSNLLLTPREFVSQARSGPAPRGSTSTLPDGDHQEQHQEDQADTRIYKRLKVARQLTNKLWKVCFLRVAADVLVHMSNTCGCL